MTIPNALSSKAPKRQSKMEDEGSQWMHKSRCSRVCVMVWMVVMAVMAMGVLVAGMLFYRRYGIVSDVQEYRPGDQVLANRVTHNLNSLLCQRYEVTSSFSSRLASVYLVDGPAKMSDQYQQLTIRNDGLRAGDLYDYTNIHLLPGSRLEMGACMSILNSKPRIQAQVLVIKGYDRFKKWQTNADCRDCVDYRVHIRPRALCGLESVIAQYVTEHEDTYYVIVTRQHRWEDDVTLRADIEMQVLRSQYDTSEAKQYCIRSSSCILNLTLGAKDDVVVTFPYTRDVFPEEVTYFSTECHLLAWFWVVVFLTVPTVLVFFFVFLACIGCRMEKAQRKRKAKKAEIVDAFTA